MEEKRISFEDIFAEDIFQRAATSAAALKGILEELDKVLAEFVKKNAENVKQLTELGKNAQNLQKLMQATRGLEGAIRAQVQVSKERARIEEQISKLQTREAQELAQLQAQYRRLRSEVDANARAAEIFARGQELVQKAAAGAFQSYKELSDTLNDLRSLYKDLAAQGKENNEEGERLKAIIQELDARAKAIDASVGQFQRNVGNYTGSIKEFFGDLVSKASEAEGIIGKVGKEFKGLGLAFQAAGGGLKGLGAAIAFTGKALAASGITLLLSLVSGQLGQKLGQLGEKIGDLLGLSGGEEALRRAQEGLAVTRRRLELELELARTAAERELTAQREGAESLRGLALQSKELDIQKQLAELARERAQAEIARIRAELEEGGFLQTQQQRAELVEQLAGAEGDLAEAEKQLLAIETQRQALAAQLAQADAERLRRLEELLAAMQAEQRAAESRVEEIQRERDERLRGLDALRQEALGLARTREEQLKVEQQYAIARREIIARAEADIAQVRAEAANQAARQLLELRRGQLEAELGLVAAEYRERYLEVERLERELGAELTALREELAQAEVEAQIRARREAALRAIATEEELAKQRLDLEARNFDNLQEFEQYKNERLLQIELDFVRKRIQALRELNENVRSEETEAELRALEAREALLDLRMRSLLAKNEDFAKKLEQIYKETGQKIAQVLDLIAELLSRAEQRAMRRLEREGAMVQRRIDLLIAQVERGSDAAGDSIALLERREAELIRQQEELRKKAQRREAALGAFRAYAAQLQQGVNPAQALLNTLRDLTLITQAIRALPVFHAGTELVKPAARPVLGAAQDTVLARLHPGERVVPADINRQLGDIPNAALPEAVRAGGKVEFDADSFLNAMRIVVKSKNRTDIYKRSL